MGVRMIIMLIDCMPLVVCVEMRLSVHGCDWVEMDRSLVVVVIGVDWVVPVVDLMLEWGFKALISVMVFEHRWMSWGSWMPVVELGVVVCMLLVIIVSLRVVSTPLMVEWDVVAHVSFMVGVDPAALIVRLVKVVMLVIMLIFVALHHICVTSIAMDHLVNQSMETGLVVGSLVVVLN